MEWTYFVDVLDQFSALVEVVGVHFSPRRVHVQAAEKHVDVRLPCRGAVPRT